MTRPSTVGTETNRKRSNKSTHRRRPKRHRRLIIEPLEDRRVLSIGIIPSWEYQTSGAYSVGVSPNADYVAVGTANSLHFLDDEGVLLWTYNTGNPVIDLRVYGDGVRTTGIVRTSSAGRPVYFFDRNGNRVLTFSGTYSSAAYSPARDYFAVTYRDWTQWYDHAALWQSGFDWLWQGERIGGSGSGSASVAANGLTAVGGALGGATSSAVRVYNRSGSLTWTYLMDGTIGAKYSVAITPDAQLIAAGNTRNTNLHVLDVAKKQLSWQYNTGNILGVSVSADGEYILAGTTNTVYLFHNSGNLLWTTGIAGIQDVGLSGDASKLVVATASGTVYGFDVLIEPDEPPIPAPIDSSLIVEAEADSTNVASQRKIAVTSDEHLHVVYYRQDAGGLTQVFHAESADGGRTWGNQQVTFGGVSKLYPSLAVDSNDVLHLVYQDANHATYYMRKTETWQAAEWVASYATTPAIAIDSNDHVHVVYGVYIYSPGYWGGGNGIRYRVRTSAGWQAEESISSNKHWTTRPAIAIDANNHVHVVWDNKPRLWYCDYHYRVRTSAGWGTEIRLNAETNNEAGNYPSIAVDSENHVHVVWHHLSFG